MKKETKVSNFMVVNCSLLFVVIQLIFFSYYYFYGLDFYMLITFVACKCLKLCNKNETILDSIFNIVYGGSIVRFGIISAILIYKLSKATIPFHKRRVYNYFATELSRPILTILLVVSIGFGLLYFSSLLKKEETLKKEKKEPTTTTTKKNTDNPGMERRKNRK